MKKLLVVSSLLLSSSVMATGFYAGGQLGVSSAHTKHTEVTTANSSELGSIGMAYGVYTGYRFDLEDFFIGGELDYNFNTAESENKAGAEKNEFKQDGSIGLHFLAGVPIGESTDIYGRIGLVETKFEGQFTNTNSGATSKFDKTIQGTVLGIGMQHHLDEMLTVRLDYRYTMYDKYTVSKANAFMGDTLENINQSFTVGLQYTFF